MTYGASFSHFSRAIHACSEPYASRFRHINNSGSFRHVMFHVYSGKFTKLHISRHIWCIYINKAYILALPIQIMQSNTCSSNQVLLLNHCSDQFGKFFDFCLISKHFNNNNNNNKSMIPTLVHHLRQPR